MEVDYSMAKRTYTQKDGTIWEWDETPKLLEQLQKLHNNTGENYDSN